LSSPESRRESRDGANETCESGKHAGQSRPEWRHRRCGSSGWLAPRRACGRHRRCRPWSRLSAACWRWRCRDVRRASTPRCRLRVVGCGCRTRFRS